MIEDSLEDINRKYMSTYMLYKHEGNDHLVWISDYEGGYFTLLSSDLGDLRVTETLFRTNTTYFFPESGLYNINGSTFEFLRNGSRQFKRAPCSENISWVSILNKFPGRQESLPRGSIADMRQVFNPNYPDDLDTAIKLCKGSIALNKDFAISFAHTDENECILWYRTNPVAMVDTITKKITVMYELLRQEIKDLLYYKEPTWTMN